MNLVNREDIIREIQIRQALWRKFVRRDPIGAMRSSLFGPQRAFFDDKSSIVGAVCSRRAGKTHGICAKLIEAALKHPQSWALYLALTRDSAKDIVWEPLKAMLREFEWSVVPHEGELEIRLPNYSFIKVLGADHKKVRETLRGPRRSIVCIDEAGSFGPGLKQTVEESIEPSLMDLNGQLVLVGTPPPSLTGYFWEVCERDRIASLHHWTVRDNPHIPNADIWMAEVLRKRNWTVENPTFRREYLGEWCQDWSRCVYKFSKSRDTFSMAMLPHHSLHWIIGLDFGWHDSTAFSVLGYHEDLPIAYCIHSEAHQHWTPSRIATHLRDLMKRYNPERIVADSGGLGKAIVEEFKQRYALPIEAAEKQEKNAFIELMNGDFIDGRLKIADHLHDLHAELMALQWDENGKETAGQANDRCDSLLYPYRWSYHYWHRDVPVRPKRGSEAWYAEEEAAMIKLAEEAYDNDKRLEEDEW